MVVTQIEGCHSQSLTIWVPAPVSDVGNRLTSVASTCCSHDPVDSDVNVTHVCFFDRLASIVHCYFHCFSTMSTSWIIGNNSTANVFSVGWSQQSGMVGNIQNNLHVLASSPALLNVEMYKLFKPTSKQLIVLNSHEGFTLTRSSVCAHKNLDMRNWVARLMKRPQTVCDSNHKSHISMNGSVLKGGCHHK